ncbi:MAG: hypothetical protein H6553_08055 [Chitinophagales bacterium]|nr:hypothetical protein [Chitinophagales bacterium]
MKCSIIFLLFCVSINVYSSDEFGEDLFIGSHLKQSNLEKVLYYCNYYNDLNKANKILLDENWSENDPEYQIAYHFIQVSLYGKQYLEQKKLEPSVTKWIYYLSKNYESYNKIEEASLFALRLEVRKYLYDCEYDDELKEDKNKRNEIVQKIINALQSQVNNDTSSTVYLNLALCDLLSEKEKSEKQIKKTLTDLLTQCKWINTNKLIDDIESYEYNQDYAYDYEPFKGIKSSLKICSANNKNMSNRTLIANVIDNILSDDYESYSIQKIDELENNFTTIINQEKDSVEQILLKSIIYYIFIYDDKSIYSELPFMFETVDILIEFSASFKRFISIHTTKEKMFEYLIPAIVQSENIEKNKVEVIIREMKNDPNYSAITDKDLFALLGYFVYSAISDDLYYEEEEIENDDEIKPTFWTSLSKLDNFLNSNPLYYVSQASYEYEDLLPLGVEDVISVIDNNISKYNGALPLKFSKYNFLNELIRQSDSEKKKGEYCFEILDNAIDIFYNNENEGTSTAQENLYYNYFLLDDSEPDVIVEGIDVYGLKDIVAKLSDEHKQKIKTKAEKYLTEYPNQTNLILFNKVYNKILKEQE